MYYVLKLVDGRGRRAAFVDESTAEMIRDRFNERYESEYEVVEDDDVLASEITQASIIAEFEQS